jgi:glutamate dehydrogenase (NAD(P)+)
MENAPSIKAKIIAEAANGPISSDASSYLYDRGTLVLPDAYINAGGVTVSYFEWLKNLSHVRFGRMEKRFEERSAREMLLAMEKATGRTLPHEESSNLARGPEEIDLVNSGLEETMIQAYHEIREIKKRHDGQMDLRMASMLAAIDKIALAYADRGIFP